MYNHNSSIRSNSWAERLPLLLPNSQHHLHLPSPLDSHKMFLEILLVMHFSILSQLTRIKNLGRPSSLFQSNALSMKWNKIWFKINCLFNSLQWYMFNKIWFYSFGVWASWSVGNLILPPIHQGDKINRPPLWSPWIYRGSRINKRRGWAETDRIVIFMGRLIITKI